MKAKMVLTGILAAVMVMSSAAPAAAGESEPMISAEESISGDSYENALFEEPAGDIGMAAGFAEETEPAVELPEESIAADMTAADEVADTNDTSEQTAPDSAEVLNVADSTVDAGTAAEIVLTENASLDGKEKEKTKTEEEAEEAEEAVDAEAEEELEQAVLPSVEYCTHVQSYGWQEYVKNGAMSGTQGKSKRLEGIRIKVNGDDDLGIRYKTHVQTYGWQDWKKDGEMSGTEKQSKRLEAIQIELTGKNASKYDVWYCVHAQHYGWLNWTKNGAEAGTAGHGYRLEGIMIRILPKGSSAPAGEGTGNAAFYSKTDGPVMNNAPAGIAYNTHVQTYGWQDFAFNGGMSGTAGKSKRLEGIHISLTQQKYSGDIEYCTHVQTYGWQDWKKNGAMAGTSGQAKRLEAIQIRLTGEMANHYDVYYRVHAQKFGWMGWAKNGEQAGTAGYSYRLEAIQIVLADKGGSAPAADLNGCRQSYSAAFSRNKTKTFPSLKSLGINYSDTVNSKVDKELREMYKLASQQGIDIDSQTAYDKAFLITQYIGTKFEYHDGSYSAESMIDTRGGTCFGYADLTYCFARKLGLLETWLTVPGRNINHGFRSYGSLHRTAVTKIDGKYYDLDSNMYTSLYASWVGVAQELASVGMGIGTELIEPEQISKGYADYLLGNTNTRPAQIP